eukprot:7579265-Pyramimonas_sp.AAC.1
MPSPSATNSRSRSPRAVGHASAARNGGAPHEGAFSKCRVGLAHTAPAGRISVGRGTAERGARPKSVSRRIRI